MLFSLCEFELLRATNAIAKQWGGRRLGSVGEVEMYADDGGQHLYTRGTYQNQWLISVELTDEAAPFGAKVAPQDHAWQIRLGFCQTTISRAPNGGWTLTIPSDLLCLCPSCEHVVDLFEAMLGAQEERQHKLELWHQSVTAWRERQQPIILAINAFIRPDALEYALLEGQIA
jgi:hypothetical protein